MSFIVSSILNSWVERVTQAPKFIDTDHAYIHAGNAFDAFAFSTGENIVRFKTPSTTATTPYVHFRPASIAFNSGSVRFRVYDANTSGDKLTGGSAFTPVNRRYNSTKTAGTAVSVGVATSSTTGYVLKYDTAVYGGTAPGQTRIGASKGEGMEWILKPDTEYALYVTSTGTEVMANFFWYEEADA